MFRIKEYYPLQKYNTFGIRAKAKYFSSLSNEGEICNFLESNYKKINPKLILGGGSNILFTKDFDGLVIKPDIRGIEIIKEDNKHVIIRVGAGENWDSIVKYCVINNYGGLENLSYIPGTVGACPVQNIGAYGAEVKDTIVQVETILTGNGEKFNISNAGCKFSYRNSIFKNELYNKCIITRVVFRLNKKPEYKTAYGSLQEELKNYKEINLNSIREAVIKIRKNKLPEPGELGNGGSFFKNPFITNEKAGKLLEMNPEVPIFPDDKGKIKVSAAWLIEQVGYKGTREGHVGTYSKQPLIIVNYVNATGMEVLQFSEKIKKKVYDNFGIQLDTEINIF